MKLLKALSTLLFIVLLIAAGFIICWYLLPVNLYNRGWNDGYAYIKPIEDLQRQIGCVKIDGKLGPCWLKSETQKKYELALGNQYAEQLTCSNVREFDRKMLAKVKR